MQPFDILIHNGTVITVNPAGDIIDNGWVGIRGSQLDAVSATDANDDLPQASKVIDANGGIIMPGLVNTHTHLPMALFRGMADDLPLQQWLEDHIFPAERRHIHPDSVQIGVRLACAEMIRSGTTTCCDGYFLEDTVAATVQEIGLRAILGQGVIDFPAPGILDPSKNVAHAHRFVSRWQQSDPRLMPSVFCHSPYTCSGDTLKRAKSAATKAGVLFQIHVAETRQERDQMMADHGLTPIGYLDRLGLLDDLTLLVHCVWVDRSDIELMANRRVRVSHNPDSNAKLAAGIAPVPQMVAAGITVGLGTDSCASNNNLDMFQVMDFAAKLHKVNTQDPTVMDAAMVLQMATLKGAKALGLDQSTGSLEVGKQADVIVVNTRQPHLTPIYRPDSHIVYAARGSDVETVIVAGRLLLDHGQLTTIDIQPLIHRAADLAVTIGREKAD